MNSKDKVSLKSKPETLANKGSSRKQTKPSITPKKAHSRKNNSANVVSNVEDRGSRKTKRGGQENVKPVEKILFKERANTASEMTTTNYPSSSSNDVIVEKETDVDVEAETRMKIGEHEGYCSTLSGSGNEETEAEVSNHEKQQLLESEPSLCQSPVLPEGWEQHSDKAGLYYWHVSTGIIQRDRPASNSVLRKESVVIYHDDEEINQAQKTSSDDDDDDLESGAALTVDETNESTFVVYPLGCCEFDETHLIPAISSKSIQKCILRLSNKPSKEESFCWGLDQSHPILMKLLEDHIQFIDLNTQILLRSQPIQTIKTWAVDDDNNFAFVIEEQASNYLQSSSNTNYFETLEDTLLCEPSLMCYVFRSMDDDDMSCKVAAKLNEEINRYKGQLIERVTKNKRLQQMAETKQSSNQDDTDDFDEELEGNNETTLHVKYIGSTPVPRPIGIDILNVAIDKCLADASRKQQLVDSTSDDLSNDSISPLVEAKLHISPSSVIVEDVVTGEIIVECRIRYLTFMGISKRDIRWCGFIMQNSNQKSFTVHCFECYPTAGHVCEAIQASCTRMYEKVIRNSRQPETLHIIPTGSKIRNTLVKTFSRIRLNPMVK